MSIAHLLEDFETGATWQKLHLLGDEHLEEHRLCALEQG